MPYIPQSMRDVIDAGRVPAATPGELNYLITTAILAGKTGGQVYDIMCKYAGDRRRYHVFNEVIGAVECAKLELERRFQGDVDKAVAVLDGCKEQYYECVVAPFEDEKIRENGDVYPDGV